MFSRLIKNKTAQSAPSQAIEFEAQLAQNANRMQSIAWACAVVACLFAILSWLALIVILPLKQTVPYIIYLDKETGVTQVADVATPVKITQNEANARHWAYQYILSRERYVYKLIQGDLEFSVALSSPTVQKEALKPYEEGPNKKDVLLRDKVEERVNVLSVRLLNSNTATARFVKETFNEGQSQPSKSESYIADVSFEWSGVQGWTEKNLLVNPMGFKVVAYRTTLESVK